MHGSHLIFVYGTLKRGQCRAAVLAGQTFLGPAVTQPRYRMFNVGDYPGLVEDAAGVAVQGEVWRIDSMCLQRLDDIEGTDIGLYQRRPILLQAGSAANKNFYPDGQSDQLDPSDQLIEAWFFLRDTSHLPDCGSEWK